MKQLYRFASYLSRSMNRRGFLRTLLRGVASIAALCSGLGASALAAQVCVGAGHGGPQPNDLPLNDTIGSDAYCNTNNATWGCTISAGLPLCTVEQGCNGNISTISSSNCGAPMVSSGWWDCCCDEKQIRCRDCYYNGLVCICRAYIADC